MRRVDCRDYPDVQAACDDAANAGHPLILAAPVDLDELLVESGLDLMIAAPLRKVSANNGGTRGSFIRNRNLDETLRDVRIACAGAGSILAADSTKTGNIIALRADDSTLERIVIERWSGGRAMVLAGDRLTVNRAHITGSPAEVGNGGIRVVGGSDFVASQCHVVSGDDALQLVPSGGGEDPLFDRSITRARFEGCTGASTAARFIAAATQYGSPAVEGDVRMSGSVDGEFTDCRGVGGVMAVVVQNLSSSGHVGVRLSGCSVDMTPSSARSLGQDVLLQAWRGTGGASLHGEVTVVGTRTSLVRASGDVDMAARVVAA